MTATFLEDPGTTRSPSIRFRAAHDVDITCVALEGRAEDLKKLAEKVGKDGYRRESRAIQADAEAIAESILPALREQRELPLVSADALELSVQNAIRTFVTQAFSGLGDPRVEISPSSVADRRDRLMKTLAKRIALYVVDVADDAYNQGVAARESTAEVLATRALATLSAVGE